MPEMNDYATRPVQVLSPVTQNILGTFPLVVPDDPDPLDGSLYILVHGREFPVTRLGANYILERKNDVSKLRTYDS